MAIARRCAPVAREQSNEKPATPGASFLPGRRFSWRRSVFPATATCKRMHLTHEDPYEMTARWLPPDATSRVSPTTPGERRSPFWALGGEQRAQKTNNHNNGERRRGEASGREKFQADAKVFVADARHPISFSRGARRRKTMEAFPTVSGCAANRMFRRGDISGDGSLRHEQQALTNRDARKLSARRKSSGARRKTRADERKKKQNKTAGPDRRTLSTAPDAAASRRRAAGSVPTIRFLSVLASCVARVTGVRSDAGYCPPNDGWPRGPAPSGPLALRADLFTSKTKLGRTNGAPCSAHSLFIARYGALSLQCGNVHADEK